MIKQTSTVSLLLALVIMGLLAMSGWSNYTLLTEKVEGQKQALNSFLVWKQQYQNLAEVRLKWNRAFRNVSEAKDLYTLHSFINTPLYTNVDMLTVDRVERHSVNSTDIGLSRVCLTTVGGAGLVLEAKSFTELMSELNRLLARPDIEATNVVVSESASRQKKSAGKSGDYKAQAIVSGFCILLKD